MWATTPGSVSSAVGQVPTLPAVAQHGDPVGDREDFLQVVRDEEDGQALARAGRAAPGRADRSRRERAAVGSSRTRIAHPPAQRLGDLDLLPLADGQAGDRRARIEVETEVLPAGSRARRSMPRRSIQGPMPRLMAERQVLGDRERLDEVQLLVDDADALGERGGRIAEPDLPAVDLDPARVGAKDAAEDLDQRALARAVLAAEGVDLARREARGPPRSGPGRRRIAWRRRLSCTQAWDRVGSGWHRSGTGRAVEPGRPSSSVEAGLRPCGAGEAVLGCGTSVFAVASGA